jgi:hypothetical protein
MELIAGVLGLRGEIELKSSGIGNDSMALGTQVANELIAQGAQALLKDIRKQLAS